VTGHITLILGGARSGKSTWAEHLASQSGRPVLFVATATAGDAEMAARIARHRAARPPDWHTVEEPSELLDAVQAAARPGEAVLVDCLTLWVSNRIGFAIGAIPDADELPAEMWDPLETSLVTEAEALVATARERDLGLMLISNEVGLGIVPATPLGRRYRDALGRVNQAVAATADSVVFMIAGLPVDLRQLTAAVGSRPSLPEHR
jgi:adenosylcobinamide kinase/adenosylcobinamide-phosphate guanylyltransferase